MSKMIVGLALVAATLSAPVLSFAQSNAPLTHAEVRADLIRVEQTGYNPEANDIHYPANIQAAEVKVAAQNDQQLTNHAVSGVTPNGSTASGAASHMPMHPSCVGSVSFCNVYSGS